MPICVMKRHCEENVVRTQTVMLMSYAWYRRYQTSNGSKPPSAGLGGWAVGQEGSDGILVAMVAACAAFVTSANQCVFSQMYRKQAIKTLPEMQI
jgi:hypothetical protein